MIFVSHFKKTPRSKRCFLLLDNFVARAKFPRGRLMTNRGTMSLQVDSPRPSTQQLPPLIFSDAHIAPNLFDEPFSSVEFENALNSCSNSTPGLDLISFSLIKDLTQIIKDMFLAIPNEIAESYNIPEPWFQSKVLAIPKPGKPANLASSYRSICLLSCPRKILEKMFHSRLDFWIESQSLNSVSQFGFRKGFGTQDCIAILASDLNEVYALKHSCGFHGYLFGVWRCADQLVIIVHPLCKIIQYAYDVVLYSADIDAACAEDNVQRAIDDLNRHYNDLGLSISSAKTESPFRKNINCLTSNWR